VNVQRATKTIVMDHYAQGVVSVLIAVNANVMSVPVAHAVRNLPVALVKSAKTAMNALYAAIASVTNVWKAGATEENAVDVTSVLHARNVSAVTAVNLYVYA